MLNRYGDWLSGTCRALGGVRPGLLPARALELAQLESRILLSAAPLPAPLPPPEGAMDVPSPPMPAALEVQQVDAGAQEQQTRRLEVAFVDSNVEDYQRLLEDLRSTTDDSRTLEVWLLDGEQDGIDQVSEILRGYSDLDAIHLISHAADGRLRLGNVWLSDTNLEAYAGQLALWNHSVREEADLLIYGCDLAASAVGRDLTAALGALTGMDVAASVDDTGHASLAGDWKLEQTSGTVETRVAVSSTVQATWQQLLAVAPVSSTIPLNQTTSNVQQHADVAMFGDGSFVAVWEDADDGDNEGIFGRLFDATGVAAGPEFRINQTTSDNQTEPAVAMDGAGNFIVVWTSHQSGDDDIYARIYSAAGVPQTGEFLVNAGHTANNQQRAGVAADAAGNFVVVWERAGPGDSDGVFGQRFLADGSTNGALFLVNDIASGTQNDPAVAMDLDGDFVITWTDTNGPGTTIRGERFDSAGMGQGTFNVQADTSVDAETSAVSMDAFGNFVVAWGKNDIRLRRFGAAGNPLSGDVLVNLTTSHAQVDPSISMDADGHFVVAWSSDNQDGDKVGIYVRAYNPDGTAASGEMQANTHTHSDQQTPQISMNDAGQLVVAWEGEGPVDSDGVFGRLYAWPEAAPLNQPPLGVADAYSVNEDSTLMMAASGVLANDTDPENDLLSALLVSGTVNGALTLNVNGSFGYTPNANFSGADSFIYRAYDGSSTSTVTTVTITVNPTNTAPVAFDNGYVVSLLLGSLDVNAPGVLGNDVDPDGDPLTALLVSGPSQGSLNFNADGSFNYIPPLLFLGSTSFTYRVTDGAAFSNVATVTINDSGGNGQPFASGNVYNVAEDGTLVVPAAGVLANDSDPDGDPLTALLVTSPIGGLTLNTDGSFIYTPVSNFSGVDTFRYRAHDSSLSSNLAIVTINVTPVNDAPVAASDNYSIAEDGVLNVPMAGVLTNDIDVDGDPLTALLVSGPNAGVLNLNADGSFSYTPNAGFNGIDRFAYRVSDGFLNSNVVQVRITVTPVNDVPLAVDDSFSTSEDTPLSVAAPGVLANDSDVEGHPLTAVLVSGPANGVLLFNADGSFDYTPNLNFNGVDSFTYRANDGGANSAMATVTINVASVNDAPVANGDSFVVNEDQVLSVPTVGVLANDLDVDGDPLTAALVSGPTQGLLTFNADGSFSYRPNANFNGTDSFDYRVSDGSLPSNVATVTITTNAVNDAPLAADDSYSTTEDAPLNITAAGVLANDGDVEGSPLTAVLVSGPTSGMLVFNADGSFDYTPNANFNGIDTFRYRANDGAANSAVATVTINVASANDAPAANGDAYVVNEDQVLNVPIAGVLANDGDIDGDPLTAVLVSGPNQGALSLNADGSFSYTPNANFNGSDSFAYRASDGSLLSTVATVTITVNSINDVPLAADDVYSTSEDAPLSLPAAGVLINDSDVDADPLTAMLVSGPTNGVLLFNAVGSFDYTPNADFNGVDTFAYRANDGGANSAIATVTINVASVNDAPVANDDTYNVNEDTTLTVPAAGVLGNDSDVDGDPLTAVLVSGPTRGSLALNADGSFSYTPDANFHGSDSFTYQANDGVVSQLATVTITVSPINDAPLAADANFMVDNDQSLVLTAPGLLASAVDVEGDSLALTVVNGPVHGSLLWNADGSLTYTPDATFSGTDVFTYMASDGVLTSNVATVKINVRLAAPPLPSPVVAAPAVPSESGRPEVPSVPSAPNVDLRPIVGESSPARPEHVTRAVPAANLAATMALPPMACELSMIVPSAALDPLVKLEQAVRRLPQAVVESTAPIVAAFNTSLLWEDLQQLRQELGDRADVNLFAAGSAVGVTSVLTAGYVLWTVRGGWLVAGLLAQMPAWRLVDPLVVLDYLNEEEQDKRDEDDSLEGMLEKKEVLSTELTTK